MIPVMGFIFSILLVQGRDRCSNFNRLILYRQNIGHGKLWNGHDILFIQVSFLVLEKSEPKILK